MQTGIAKKVRGALKLLNRPDGVPNARLAEALDLVGGKEKRPMYRAIDDMVKRGEVVKIAPGVHRYVGRPDPSEKQRVMWRALRALRQSGQAATVDDMVQMAGVSRSYAQEFLQGLARREIVRRTGPSRGQGKFILIKDRVAFPDDGSKAERLRRLREKQAAAKTALETAASAVGEAIAAAEAVLKEES